MPQNVEPGDSRKPAARAIGWLIRGARWLYGLFGFPKKKNKELRTFDLGDTEASREEVLDDRIDKQK